MVEGKGSGEKAPEEVRKPRDTMSSAACGMPGGFSLGDISAPAGAAPFCLDPSVLEAEIYDLAKLSSDPSWKLRSLFKLMCLPAGRLDEVLFVISYTCGDDFSQYAAEVLAVTGMAKLAPARGMKASEPTRSHSMADTVPLMNPNVSELSSAAMELSSALDSGIGMTEAVDRVLALCSDPQLADCCRNICVQAMAESGNRGLAEHIMRSEQAADPRFAAYLYMEARRDFPRLVRPVPRSDDAAFDGMMDRIAASEDSRIPDILLDTMCGDVGFRGFCYLELARATGFGDMRSVSDRSRVFPDTALSMAVHI